jgi:uncharacterized protein (TIGR02679 family)
MNQEPALQKAVTFFKQPTWTRLMSALYTKYIEQGQVRGQVVLPQYTPDEQREIARFLGKSLKSEANLKVRLADFQLALTNSSFACELPTLLLALFPERPHITKAQQKEQQARSQHAFNEKLTELLESLSFDSLGRSWLTSGKHGKDAFFRQHKNEPYATQIYILQILQMIIQALDQLPTPPQFQYLSHFALRISGDPHFFDANTAGGRLFLTALMDLRSLANVEQTTNLDELDQPEHKTPKAEQDHWRHLLYYESGLLLDTISSTVAIFHLKEAQAEDGQYDTFIAHADSRILVLPLRQLLTWKKLYPSSQHVYVFENPQVFETVVDRLLQHSMTKDSAVFTNLPTLVCTSGWPSVASIRLLSLLVESSPDTQLHYSGDFDLQGLRIANYLLLRYPQNCQLWHFDPDAYLTALHQRGMTFEANEIAGLQNLPEIFSPLTNSMLKEQRKAYHEGITDILLDDIFNKSHLKFF